MFACVFVCRWTLLIGFSSVVVAAGSCDRSCRPRLLPTHSFARYRWRLSSAALHSGCRRVHIWCEFLAERATPSNGVVRLARAALQSPHLRLHSSWPKREGSRSAVTDRIEQRWLNLGCGNVSLLVDLGFVVLHPSGLTLAKRMAPADDRT